jgi:hypothetical protein
MTKKYSLTRTEFLLARILLQLAKLQGDRAMLAQLEMLRSGGFAPDEVAVIVGTTPATIAVTLSRERKKRSKK